MLDEQESCKGEASNELGILWKQKRTEWQYLKNNKKSNRIAMSFSKEECGMMTMIVY